MRYIIFDFDGTIADTFHVVEKYVNELKKKYDVKNIEFSDIRDHDIIELLRKAKIPVWEMLVLLGKVKRELHRDISERAKPFTGMKTLLSSLSKKYTLGVLSSNSKNNIEDFLEKNNLRKYFSFVYINKSLFRKDKTLKKMMKKEGIGKSEMIYVGDEKRDIESCKRIYVPIISVSWGYNNKEFLSNFNPDYIADKPLQIGKIVSKIK